MALSQIPSDSSRPTEEQRDDETQIQISVMMMDGTVITCNMALGSTVLDLKKAIERETEKKFQVDQQVLMAGGGVRMRDAQMLADYNISTNSSVTMAIQAMRSEEEKRAGGALKIQSLWKKRLAPASV